jgi:hypothetical protein
LIFLLIFIIGGFHGSYIYRAYHIVVVALVFCFVLFLFSTSSNEFGFKFWSFSPNPPSKLELYFLVTVCALRVGACVRRITADRAKMLSTHAHGAYETRGLCPKCKFYLFLHSSSAFFLQLFLKFGIEFLQPVMSSKLS